MSEPFGFRVYFKAPFGPDSVLAIAEAVSRAVTENWAGYRDRLSDTNPRFPVLPEQWLERARPEALRGNLGGAEPPLFSESIVFNYSPLSAKTGGIVLARRADGTISAGFLVAHSARHERPELREERRPDSERQGPPPDAPQPWDDGYEEWEEAWNAPYNVDLWSLNKQCILHILECLEQALPVESIIIDEPLRA